MQELKLFVKNVYLIFFLLSNAGEKRTQIRVLIPTMVCMEKIPLLRFIINANFVCNSGKNRRGQKHKTREA